MTSGAVSNANKSRNWREKKVKAGYIRLTLWLDKNLGEDLSDYAGIEMVPRAVAAEMLIRKHFEEEKDELRNTV
jgi:hypothetical protein